VVSENKLPHLGVTDFEEVRWIQGNANRVQRRVEEQRRTVPLYARDLFLEFKEAGLPTLKSILAP
jgi:hypothetical protein